MYCHPECNRQHLKKVFQEKFRRIFVGAGFQMIKIHPIKNEYCDDDYCAPWFEITTEFGVIKIGWRNQVINIDWSRITSPVATRILSLFEKEEVTKDANYIHAWGWKRARLYIKKMLIVEDNAEVRDFLNLCLEGEFDVAQAENGKFGLEMAFEDIPDLIITDVAMPEMDGNEFCRIIKNDERTSHIPVIMLTAKTEVEQQIEGLESGADIYLTKPFSIKVLQSYIKNLLNAKETLRKFFSQKILIEPLDIEVGSVDKKFMERLMDIINNNLNNPDFHINDLSKQIGMSTAVLYKKFNALVQMPVAEFIKTLRLKKASKLLKDKSLNISEVAWEVGFNDRKYFSKEFKKFFGYNPSELPDIG